ncbi:restriction endonuclease subunit S [Campylobacter curvus]|uniref:restriction endonuclease subunit S n=1 Tax=Campylobacter curvus TaxID=200 RepID=UPI000378F894|nr:restriction endonuclease subunit S [Campylobacter curvus]QKF61161.1 type I restriction/modification system, specificity subunit [Campylobacter curvus]UEB49481.1 restriction endonuclease subunit S [Campylobacter curvus]
MSSQIYEGQIPDGWYVATLGEICEISAGGDLGRLTFSHIKTDKFLNPIYSNAVSNNGLYGYSSDFDFEGNFVTVTARGYIGYAVARSGKFCSIGRLLNLKPKFDISCYYVAEYINQFIYFVIESTGVPQLTVPQISKYKILMPKDKAEQERIAQVLGDMDDLISAKCKLLDKKRDIKQGVAQQLLTPKPHWHTAMLGEILQYEQPTNYIIQDIEILEKGSVPVLTAGKSFILGYTEEEFDCYENFPVIIFDDFTTDSKFVNFRFKVKSSAMKMLKPKNEKISIKLAFMLLQNINFFVGDHKRHWISEFSKFEISFPDITEQTKIAQILSDMDDEISALQDEIEKLKMIKQGVMGELLSGKIRLKG